MAARDPRIDAAKAIGIVLVVLGHAKGCPPWLVVLLYSFHVPLFFWLAGAVVSEARLAEPLARSAARLGRSLLLPYLFFFGVAYAYWLLTRGMGEKALRWGAQPWWEPLQGFVTGNGALLYVDPALWFLPALFLTALAYALLRQRFAAGAVAVAVAVAGLGWAAFFPQAGMRLPFALDILPVALVFYAAGAAIRVPALRGPGGLAVALALGVVWWAMADFNGRVDLNHLRFGASAPLYFLAAAAGIHLCLAVAGSLPDSAAVRWLARNSLLIFASHMLVFSVLSGLAGLAGPRPESFGFAWTVAAGAVAILASVPMRAVLAVLAPWALGGRSAQPAARPVEQGA